MKKCHRKSVFYLRSCCYKTPHRLEKEELLQDVLMAILYNGQHYVGIPSTLNINFILWHKQMIVCAVEC